MGYIARNGNALVAAGAAAAGPASPPFTSVPAGALDAWTAAKAGAAGAVVSVAGIGDSILRGAAASPGNGFWTKLVAALQAKYGSAGEGFHGIADTTDPAYGGATGYSADVTPCWTYANGSSGSWQDWHTWGLGGQARVGGGAGAKATGVFSGTGVDVLVATNGGGGPFTVSVDGVPYDKGGIPNGSGGNPSCNGATASPLVAVSIRGLPDARHTIVLQQVGAQNLVLHGIVAYSGVPRGVLPWRMGVAGKSAYQTLINRNVDSARSSVELLPMPPKLLVVEHIVNDMQQLVAYNTFAYQARRLCDSARACGASILFVIPAIGPVVGNWLNYDFASFYIDRVYGMARRYNAAVLDVNAAWEALGPAVSAGLIRGGGDAHPSDAGHADIAGWLQALLV